MYIYIYTLGGLEGGTPAGRNVEKYWRKATEQCVPLLNLHRSSSNIDAVSNKRDWQDVDVDADGAFRNVSSNSTVLTQISYTNKCLLLFAIQELETVMETTLIFAALLSDMCTAYMKNLLCCVVTTDSKSSLFYIISSYRYLTFNMKALGIRIQYVEFWLQAYPCASIWGSPFVLQHTDVVLTVAS